MYEGHESKIFRIGSVERCAPSGTAELTYFEQSVRVTVTKRCALLQLTFGCVCVECVLRSLWLRETADLKEPKLASSSVLTTEK
jgi:hypothetical protein